MRRDPDLYSRIEFGWFLGALTIGLTVGGVLPVDWWVKLLIGLALALVMLPLLGWLSGPLGRVLRFLLVPVLPKPKVRQTGGVRVTGGGRLTVGKQGASSDDPTTSRVLIEFAEGDLHPHYVLPPGEDPLPLFWETVKSVSPDVRSVRAMKGFDEVKRWRPSLVTRIARAWRQAGVVAN